MFEITKDDPTDITEILDVIHDNPFDLDDIIYKEKEKRLEIRFLREDRDNAEIERNYFIARKINIPFYECFLSIHHVEDWNIVDTEKVGTYDFNNIIYENDFQKIKITTGIPLLFEIVVTGFNISVLQTDNIVNWKTVTTIFW